MHRDFERKTKLPPFRCDLAAFEAYLKEIMSEFGTDKLRVSLSVKLPGEALSFDSIDEMRSYEVLPPSITRIDASIHGKDRHFSFFSGVWCDIAATGTSEAWCAGLVEKTRTFARSHRAWHWFIKPWLIYLLWLTGIVLVPALKFRIGSTISIPIIPLLTLAVFTIICLYLFFSYDRVFRPLVIVVHQRESFVRRYSTELTVAAALVAALAAIYTAFK